MALPIDKNKFTGEVSTKKFTETVAKSLGASGKRVEEKEISKIMRGGGSGLENKFKLKSTSKLSPKQQEQALQALVDSGEHKFTPNIKGSLHRGIERLQPTQEEIPQKTTKPSGSGFLASMFRKQRTASSDQYSQMTDRRSRQQQYLEGQLGVGPTNQEPMTSARSDISKLAETRDRLSPKSTIAEKAAEKLKSTPPPPEK